MKSALHLPPDDLLGRARAGDRSALGRLLEAHGPYLSLLARLQIGRRLQGKIDPADLVQETFLAAQSGFTGFRGATDSEFVSWLRQIFATRLSDLLRRYLGTRGHDVRLERELELELDHSSRILDRGLIDPQSSPSYRASRREHSVFLAATMARLPEDYREVLVLRHLEELPFAEVAQRMGRTEDSVQKLWLRALTRLRRTLGGERECSG